MVLYRRLHPARARSDDEEPLNHPPSRHDRGSRYSTKMRTTLVALALVVAATGAEAASPAKVGTCAATNIKAIGTRFEDKLAKPKKDDIDQCTSIALANETYGVSYSFEEPVYNSRVGDKVLTFLVQAPKDCPKGDDRGKVYTTTNLRTLQFWTLSDSQHNCGGA